MLCEVFFCTFTTKTRGGKKKERKNQNTLKGGGTARAEHRKELTTHARGPRAPGRGFAENLWYTRTLPRHSLSYRYAAKLPSAREAIRFAYAGTGPFTGKIPPFGFHGAAAFRALHAAGKIL